MNWIVLATVVYVLVAVAMIVLILMQRGAGAAAGSGFGAGASATVFGASGSANFLSKSTKWLAVLFFSMSLGMAWYASEHGGRLMPAQSDDAGLMSGVGEDAPAAESLPAPPAPQEAADEPAATAPEAAIPSADSTETPVEGDSGG